jgi:murein L,D-transpeptidase YcbB/YkuD
LLGAATSPLAAALQQQPWRPPAPCGARDALAIDICRAAGPVRDPGGTAAFYRNRRARPLWVSRTGLRPEARAAVSAMAEASRDGLDPDAYLTPELKAALAKAHRGDDRALARAEVALSAAVGHWAADLHDGVTPHPLSYIDPSLNLHPLTPRAALATVAAAPTPAQGVQALERMNPIYESLRARLAAYRAARPGQAPDHSEQLILANMERARVIPADPGSRFILVDAAGQRLQLYENGRVVHEMDVAVGKPTEPTPEMAGVIRFLVFNPYWNVPPDLVRTGIARKVMAGGPSALASQRMEALADWSDHASVLDPGEVDWSAVAAGRQILRVRQLPGPGNMMGRVKFMLPNPLGVYLHDTPKKSVFLAAQRNVSAGCVRLADALSLASWLMPNTQPPAPASTETRVDLDRPVPVYILYFTVAPTADGLTVRRDVYGRDRELLARLSAAVHTVSGGRARAT